MSQKVSAVKRNNFLRKECPLMNNIKFFIIFEALLGVNRLYLLDIRNWIIWFSYIHYVLLILFTMFFIAGERSTATNSVFRNTISAEYFILGLSALFFQKNKLKKFILVIKKFDEELNIYGEKFLLIPKRNYFYAICAAILYDILENIYNIYFFLYQYNALSFYNSYMYLPIVAHENEIIFYCFLLSIILKRLYVLKAHVAKSFLAKDEEANKKQVRNKFEELASRVVLDISSLHKIYDLLHKSSEQLNSFISFPLVVMMFASGLSTIMILKNAIKEVQTVLDIFKSSLVFSICRCLKYIILLFFPCYFSNQTKRQVANIRTMIYDTLNNSNFSKTDRRKIKAFFQLTHENEFSYALWGIIKLDMTLPLSYTSVCITYLIIVVQFSKFID